LPRISVLETPAGIAPGGLAGHVAVVIDVLRATSSITTAISSGCRSVIPAGSKDEAVRLKSVHPGALLGGEIGGRKIEGFDLGNSPGEYGKEAVSGKDIIMSTSNGTKAILGAKRGGADPVLICSFLNLDAVAREVLSEVAGQGKHVAIVCSGSLGQFSLEDFACAGALVKALCRDCGPAELAPDGPAKKALETFNTHDSDPIKVFCNSPHGQNLKEMGFEGDLELCARGSSLDAVPRFDGERIIGYRLLEG
jgi:2-phosphosulfolactate phosphatase